MAALTGPMWMLKLSYLVDNPWGNALTKAEKAGRLLADTLRGQVQNNRPVTLVGFSLGARVIFYCLLELAAQGAYGIIEDAYLYGCPVMASKQNWEAVASVVAGKIYNGYCSNDMLLGVLYRASYAVWKDVAGLQPVLGVEGVISVDLKDTIQGHLEYRSLLPLVLQKSGFNITKDFFEDQEDEEEQEIMEAKMEKARINEEKLREKEEKLRKKQAEYEAKKIETERKKAEARLAKEKAASNSITSWFSRGSKESLKKDAFDDATNGLWQPRELKSTLPPLVINTAQLSSSPLQKSATRSNPSSIHQPSSAEFDKNMQEPGLNSLLDLNAEYDEAVNNSLDNFMLQTTMTLGAGDIVDRNTDFEYQSEPEEEPVKKPNVQTLPIDSKRRFGSFDSLEILPPSPSFTRERMKSVTAESPRSPRNSPHTRMKTSDMFPTENNPWE
jgi:hypothetical protein